MAFIPLQPPSGLDTDGLRKHGEDQFREVARAWTEVDAALATLEARIAALEAVPPVVEIPVSSVMLFYMSAAPTGWTRVTTQNDKALRVVGASGGGVAGGTNSFSSVMAQTVVGGTALSVAQMPVHTHSLGSGSWLFMGYIVGGGGAAGSGGFPFSTSATTDSAGSGATHNHSITMSIQYIDIILASKN